MLGFMDYVQSAWFASTGWDADNSYGTLNATARALLDFTTPVGMALHCSSLASRSFANSYSLGNAGAVDGSLSYLYSSRPLLLLQPGQELNHYSGDGSMATASSHPPRTLPSRSPDIPLRSLIRGYRELADLRLPEDAREWEVWHAGRRVDIRDTLLYGRLYLPQARLEALYMRRLSPTAQLKIACVSSSRLRNGGSILFTFQRDTAKLSTEYLYSTDGGLLGIRGLYNFGPEPRENEQLLSSSALFVSSSKDPETSKGVAASASPSVDEDTGKDSMWTRSAPPLPPNGRFSAGAELYYGALNKTGGMSLGCRFATLPRHRGFPYTMTLTLNPLMGNLSSTYAVKAGPALSLATRFDFNVYSYESEYQVGFELWKKKRELDAMDNEGSVTDGATRPGSAWITEETREAAGSMISGLQPEDAPGVVAASGAFGKGFVADASSSASISSSISKTILQQQALSDEETAGVLKARVNQHGVLGVLWEGRVKQLLYTFGLNVDFGQREQIFRGVGVEFHYSS